MHVHMHKTWKVETQDHQHVNSAGEPSRNFSAFLHTLLGLHWERGKGETPLGPEGDGGGATTYLDPVLSVEVSRTQTGIEAVAQALQQPHSWEQLTFVLEPGGRRETSESWPRKLKPCDFPPPPAALVPCSCQWSEGCSSLGS